MYNQAKRFTDGFGIELIDIVVRQIRYSDAYEADPEFFELWRTLESYRKTIPTLRKVLSTDMEYFDLLYGKEN